MHDEQDLWRSFPRLFGAMKRADGFERYREQAYREAIDRGEEPERAPQIAD